MEQEIKQQLEWLNEMLEENDDFYIDPEFQTLYEEVREALEYNTANLSNYKLALYRKKLKRVESNFETPDEIFGSTLNMLFPDRYDDIGTASYQY